MHLHLHHLLPCVEETHSGVIQQSTGRGSSPRDGIGPERDLLHPVNKVSIFMLLEIVININIHIMCCYISAAVSGPSEQRDREGGP